MANADKVNGFRPAWHLTTGPWNGQVRRYFSAADVAPGDIVKLSGTSSTVAEVGVDGVPGVAALVAEDGNAVGVVVAVDPNPSDLSRVWHDQSVDGDTFVTVADDPFILFEGQEDGDTTPIAVASVGLVFDIIAAGVDTTTGASGMEIDSTATAGADLRVVELVQRPDNELGANARWLCLLNHIYLQPATGV